MTIFKIKRLCYNNKKEGIEMIKLVMVRHGQSRWNLENRFTGWTDVDLSEKGISEAKNAGHLLKENGYHFDLAYTSALVRAQNTLKLICEELMEDVPTIKTWRLNERHYGALQGLNKAETALKYGDEQVKLWRRSTDVRPPALDICDKRHPANDPKYADLSPEEKPATENLIDTIKRVMPIWEKEIAPKLKLNKKIIIVAHGNSLRALVKYLDNLSEEEIIATEIPTGTPLIYELDDNLSPINHYYLK